MNPLARAIIASAGASAPAAFTYDDIPDQLLRINSLEGSLAFSGAVLTGVTDVSGAGETVTVTGSPVYTAANANLNNAPSFGPPRINVPNINKGAIRFIAAAFYLNSTDVHYLIDSGGTGGRIYVQRNNTGTVQTGAWGTIAVTGEASTGRKRLLLAADGATASTWNGVAYGTHTTPTETSTGINIGSRYTTDVQPATAIAFLMICSAVPDSTTRAALEAKLLADFG